MKFIDRKNKTWQSIRFRDFWEQDNRQVTTSYKKLRERIETLPPLSLSKPLFNGWKWIAMVASVALLITGGLYWNSLTRRIQQQIETVYVAENATQITLSDGTKVWLSDHSQLRCQQYFTGKSRDVALEGEAYFEVAHNRKQPFRVLTGGKTVEVLGTSFNVRAYTQEALMKIALVKGSVSVSDDMSGQMVLLKPAQEAVFDKHDGSLAVNNIHLDLLMSWKTGRYVFNNITFDEIAKTLEKGFNVTIRIENETLKSKLFTMRFENGESLEEILELIRINAKYTFQYNNGIVVIK